MQNIETLKAQLETVKAQAAAKVAEAIETAKLTAELNLLQNDKFQAALVAQSLREGTTKRLAELEAICESIVNDNPVYSAVLKQNRVWKPSRTYGYGNQFASITGLLNGIQYSVSEHNSLMLAATGLSADLVEATLDAIGSLPYFSSNYSQIIEGKPMNVQAVRDNMALIGHALGVSIDLTAVTQATADRLYATAQAKAEKAEAEAQLGEALQQFVITR